MHEQRAVTATEQVLTADEYRIFRELIERETGVGLKKNGRLTFHLRVSHRLAILGIGTYGAYLRHVISDPLRQELNILLCHLVDKKPVFFRERSQFELFSRTLEQIASAKQARGEKSLGVLSLFTAAGEEAYSLGATIQKSGLFNSGWNIAVTGMDPDADAISFARTGSYGRDSFRGMENKKNFIEENFDPDGERFVVKKALRENVTFRVGNAVDSRSFAGLGGLDVVFCRNMLSHMSADGIQRAVGNIHRVLADGGYLFLGISESIIQLTDLFLAEHIAGLVLYRKGPIGCRMPDTVHGGDHLRNRAG